MRGERTPSTRERRRIGDQSQRLHQRRRWPPRAFPVDLLLSHQRHQSLPREQRRQWYRFGHQQQQQYWQQQLRWLLKQLRHGWVMTSVSHRAAGVHRFPGDQLRGHRVVVAAAVVGTVQAYQARLVQGIAAAAAPASTVSSRSGTAGMPSLAAHEVTCTAVAALRRRTAHRQHRRWSAPQVGRGHHRSCCQPPANRSRPLTHWVRTPRRCAIARCHR